jgi:hypothetical protein
LLAGPPQANGPNWLTDYDQANQQGQDEKKPLAIFVGKGKDGACKLIRKGKMTSAMRQLLSEKYVCVYANTKKKAGRRLAKKFHIDKGLLISDRLGKRLALRHEGTVRCKALKRYLTKYADPDLVVKRTERHRVKKRQPAIAPAPMMMGGGGGGC